MVTSSTPMPMPAMKRQRSTAKPERLERHDGGGDRVPDQREGEHGAPAVVVGDVAQADGADEQAGEQGEHERADAGDAVGAQDVEHAQRVRR